jgi:hypothetical protein
VVISSGKITCFTLVRLPSVLATTYCIRVDLKYINSLSPNSYFKKVLFVYYISAEHLTPTSFGMGGLHQNEKNLQKKAKFE